MAPSRGAASAGRSPRPICPAFRARSRWPTSPSARRALWAAERKKEKPSIVRGLWMPLSRAAFLEGSALSVLTALVNTVGKPLLLLYMTRSFDPAYGISKEVSFGLAAVLTVALWAENWSRAHGMHYAGDRAVLRASAERHDPARRRARGDAARRRRQGGRRDDAGRQRPDALGRVPQILPNVCDLGRQPRLRRRCSSSSSWAGWRSSASARWRSCSRAPSRARGSRSATSSARSPPPTRR